MLGADGARVLIVDDDPGIAGLLTDILEDEGYRPVASVGAQGLALALADPPDLVLLDAMMPGLDGPGVCRRLNADPRTRDVPVVFVTAMPADFLAARLHACTYAGVIQKPFTLGEVLMTVHGLLAHRAGGALQVTRSG